MTTLKKALAAELVECSNPYLHITLKPAIMQNFLSL